MADLLVNLPFHTGSSTLSTVLARPGVDSPYEPPEAADLRVNTLANSAEQAADSVIDKLRELRMIA
jgi:adenylylsulfate kinase-like enzyme